MDKMREAFVNEITRLEEAIKKSNSEYLKKDYQKAVNKMYSELKEYDYYKSLSNH